LARCQAIGVSLNAKRDAFSRSTTDTSTLCPPESEDLRRLVTRLRSSAAVRNHRRALLISGDAHWTVSAAERSLSGADGRTFWLSDRSLGAEYRPLSAATKLLGAEVDTIVYDAVGGFDPDGFGAAVGSLRGGGLLLLLTPPLDRWPTLVDPQADRIAVAPLSPKDVSGRFIARFARVLAQAPEIIKVSQGRQIPKLPRETSNCLAERPEKAADACLTLDQHEAMDAVLRTARGRARRPLIMTSDRGRGKSSALGIATARLLEAGVRRIRVTAPRRSAVDPLFHHAARLLPNAQRHSNRIEHSNGKLVFLPPDRLCRDPEKTDLLLIDEAAGIPAPLLERLLTTYPRVVFATTIHGYEGTGRGFEIRFRRTLETLAPNHRSIELRTPIRWAADDPLERLAARALLLDAAPATDRALAHARRDGCRYECIDRERLANDEATLSEVFGLLILAHYQTRPLDLRHLLDGPNIQVHLLRFNNRVAATALVAVEGGFEPGMAQQVFDGKRRPRGHLLPQTLSVHAGLPEATVHRCARIVRIAVHPVAQGRGLGRLILQQIRQDAVSRGLDTAGASFGATAGLLRFWRQCGFLPVHLGTSRNASSGAHAAVVLYPLAGAGRNLTRLARDRFKRRFPGLLAGPFRALEPEIAAALMASGKPEAQAKLDWPELVSFAFAQHPFEAALPVIGDLLKQTLSRALREDRLTDQEGAALIAKALQYRDWSETATLLGATGKAQVIDRLREAVRKLIQAYGPVEFRKERLSEPPR
jgi:tRNA(Met) cytidine acetyltransferase